MYVVGLRETLKDLLKTRYTFNECATMSDLPTGALEGVVLVDEFAVGTAELSEFRQSRQELNILYLVDTMTNAKETFALAHKVEIVDTSNLLNYLRQLDGERNEQPVLTFWGVLPQLGTTTIALSTASHLSEEYGVSVGVIGLNNYNAGSWPIPKPTRYLDDIKSFLRMRQLTPEKLQASMETLPSGAKYLLGNRNQTLTLQYQIEDIAYLIALAKEAFEVVVLDAGSILNTGSALQALLAGTFTYVVTTDLLYTQDQFQHHVQHVIHQLGLKTEDMLLIGNKMKSTKNLTAFAKAMHVTPLAGIPDYRELMYFSEQQSDKLKLFNEQKDFKGAIRQITEAVTVKYSMAAAAVKR